MVVFTLASGTPSERLVIRQALRDFALVSGRVVVARKNGPRSRRIVISDEAFGPADHDSVGYHLKGKRSDLIALRPGLPPSTLYTVFIHELGHYLGLELRAGRVMAPRPETRGWGRLTRSLRRRVTTELTQLLLASAIKRLE